MQRLSRNPTNMLEGLRKIQLSLSDRKKRIGYDLVKQLLVGSEEEMGMLDIVMGGSNELVVSEGLQLLNWLVSAETNREC